MSVIWVTGGYIVRPFTSGQLPYNTGKPHVQLCSGIPNWKGLTYLSGRTWTQPGMATFIQMAENEEGTSLQLYKFSHFPLVLAFKSYNVVTFPSICQIQLEKFCLSINHLWQFYPVCCPDGKLLDVASRGKVSGAGFRGGRGAGGGGGVDSLWCLPGRLIPTGGGIYCSGGSTWKGQLTL